MDGLGHDSTGTAIITISRDEFRALYNRCTGTAPLRESIYFDPVYGVDEGDVHDAAWDDATAFWCTSELTAQLVAAYEHSHGHRTIGMMAIDHGDDAYVVVSSRQ